MFFKEHLDRMGKSAHQMDLNVDFECAIQEINQLAATLVDKDGYVYKAAVNVDQEMVEMMEAGRQYQNNIEVISTIRALMMRTLNLGK